MTSFSKKLMLLKQLMLEICFKKLTKKIGKLKINFMIIINLLTLMILINVQLQYLMKNLKSRFSKQKRT